MKKSLILLSLLIVAVLLLASCGTQTVKLQDYVSVEFSPAYNGYAHPELTIDENGLNELLDSKSVFKFVKSAMKSNDDFAEVYDDLIEMYEEDPSMLPQFTDLFYIYFDENYEKLSNGDKVSATIFLNNSLSMTEDFTVEEVAKQLGIKFAKTTIEFKASGLEDVTSVPIDLNKLFTVDFGTYNGYATPTVEVNVDYLNTAPINEVVDSYAKSSRMDVKKVILGDRSAWFDVEFDEAYKNIKNGDTLKVKLVLNEVFTDNNITLSDLEAGLAINLAGGTKTYVVSGLEEPKNVVDLFEGIEQYITFSGANGHGYIGYNALVIPDDYSKQIDDLYFSKGYYKNSIKIVHGNTKLGEISFYIDGDKLSKGDILSLTATAPVKELESLGYIVPSLSTNVTVPDLGEHLTSQSQLTPELIETLKAEICTQSGATAIDKFYLATYKPGVECNSKSTAFIVGIYYKKAFFSSGYYIDELRDIIIKPDGTISVEDYTAGSWIYCEDTLDGAIGRLSTEHYDFVEIN